MALPYLDDTCIHSKTFDEHVDILDTVFEAHCKAGLTLQPDKCQLFRPSIEYLGHVISAKGISPLPSHLDAVKNWEFPSTITQMRAFLGKVNYYRKFIPQYSSMAGVLSETIKGAPKKNQSIAPTTKMMEAFQKLKQALLEAPILAYPQFHTDEPFILDTDWSKDNNSIGAVLSQVQEGVERVILYGAKKLNTAQSNYSSNKGEIFAAIHFMRQWRYYLTQRKFCLLYTSPSPRDS